jgi:Ca2+-transporting ATPase
LFGGILTDIILFLMFWFLYNQGLAIAKLRTFCFAGFAFGSFCYAFSCKNFRKNIWEYNPFSNKVLNFTLTLGMALLLLSIYFSPFQALLKTVPLGIYEWGVLIIFGLVNLGLFEGVKYFLKKSS